VPNAQCANANRECKHDGGCEDDDSDLRHG
jgi:hypothetical protein